MESHLAGESEELPLRVLGLRTWASVFVLTIVAFLLVESVEKLYVAKERKKTVSQTRRQNCSDLIQRQAHIYRHLSAAFLPLLYPVASPLQQVA